MPQHKIQTATSAYLGRSTRDLADLLVDEDPRELAKLTDLGLLELYNAGKWWSGPTHRPGPQEVLRRVQEDLLPYYVLSEAEGGRYSILHCGGWWKIPSDPKQFINNCIKLAFWYLRVGSFDMRRLPPEGPWGHTGELMANERIRRLPLLEEGLRKVKCDKPIKSYIDSLRVNNWWLATATNDGLFVSCDPDDLPFAGPIEPGTNPQVGLDLSNCAELAMGMFLQEDYLDVGPWRTTNLFRLGELVPASDPRRIVDGRVLVASMTGCGKAAQVLRPPP